jgi:hypothetical protein
MSSSEFCLQLLVITDSEAESYVTTDGQSASLSWNKVPIWGLRPDFYYCQTVEGLLIWGSLSDERTGVSFTIAAGANQLPFLNWHEALVEITASKGSIIVLRECVVSENVLIAKQRFGSLSVIRCYETSHV